MNISNEDFEFYSAFKLIIKIDELLNEFLFLFFLKVQSSFN